MSRGQLFTVAGLVLTLVLAIIGGVATMSREMGETTEALRGATKSIDDLKTEVGDLDHTWAARIQTSEARLADYGERIAALEARVQ